MQFEINIWMFTHTSTVPANLYACILESRYVSCPASKKIDKSDLHARGGSVSCCMFGWTVIMRLEATFWALDSMACWFSNIFLACSSIAIRQLPITQPKTKTPKGTKNAASVFISGGTAAKWLVKYHQKRLCFCILTTQDLCVVRWLFEHIGTCGVAAIASKHIFYSTGLVTGVCIHIYVSEVCNCWFKWPHLPCTTIKQGTTTQNVPTIILWEYSGGIRLWRPIFLGVQKPIKQLILRVALPWCWG